VEIFETRWPWLHERYALNLDSGGAGRHRGGLGIERIMEFSGEVVTISALMDRTIREPWGLFGGAAGGLGGLQVKRHGRHEFITFQEEWGTASQSKFANVRLGHGDVVRLISPSGGGYGDPLDRLPADVAADVREGFVSVDSAAGSYGVVFSSDGRVDEGATAKLRHRMRTSG
jgi:N-methylhydantoinase B/oxoprolinase/acetone carboxylase alpha subunit